MGAQRRFAERSGERGGAVGAKAAAVEAERGEPAAAKPQQRREARGPATPSGM